jgi:hypothetical protein
LADIWANADDRTAVTAASERIDRLLGVNPQEVAEFRDYPFRFVVDPPLAVVFAVLPETDSVLVTEVRPARRSR